MTADGTRRWALLAGVLGLVGGLALGATGLASAVAPSPSPGASSSSPEAKRHAAPGAEQGRRHPLRAAHRRGGGLVTAISDSSLTVRGPRGTHTVQLTSSTAFYDGPAKVSRSAVSVGDIVRIQLVEPKAADPVASVVRVVPAAVAGWVMSTSGATLTIKDLDGFTRTITTSDQTKVFENGAETTTAAIAVGDFVHAVGAVAPDGTTLQARRIGIGAPEKGMRHHPRGTRPGEDDAMADDQPDA